MLLLKDIINKKYCQKLITPIFLFYLKIPFNIYINVIYFIIKNLFKNVAN